MRHLFMKRKIPLLWIKSPGIGRLNFILNNSACLFCFYRDVAKIHNLRLRAQRLVGMIDDLAKYGPMKREEDRGYLTCNKFAAPYI